MRILLVEDDVLIGHALKTGLMQENYAVDWVTNAAQAKAALDAYDYCMMLLDLGLPDVSGLTLLSSIRRSGCELPVMIVTARNSVAERVRGLDLGADDYIIKPFDIEELSARLRALLRREKGRGQTQLQHRDVRLDPATHSVTQCGRPVPLSRREFSLLQLLMHNRGKTVARHAIEDSLYAWNEEVESNTVQVYVHKLRQHLGQEFIRTVRGVGYIVDLD